MFPVGEIGHPNKHFLTLECKRFSSVERYQREVELSDWNLVWGVTGLPASVIC